MSVTVMVFGISQQSEHKCLLIPVERRDEKTLMGLIKKYVEPSSKMTIISDGWASYNKIKEAGYNHSVVVHTREFVNSAGDHTNSIESIWSQFKNWICSMHGVKRSCYEEYMYEFTYRFNFCGGCRNSCLEEFLVDLKNYQNLRN